MPRPAKPKPKLLPDRLGTVLTWADPKTIATYQRAHEHAVVALEKATDRLNGMLDGTVEIEDLCRAIGILQRVVAGGGKQQPLVNINMPGGAAGTSPGDLLADVRSIMAAAGYSVTPIDPRIIDAKASFGAPRAPASSDEPLVVECAGADPED